MLAAKIAKKFNITVMINYTQTKICEISDPDFQSMIAELCRCVFLGQDQFVNQPLSFLLMAIVREKRAMTRQHLPTDGILTMRVDKLSPGSVVYDVCQEMVNQKGAHIESFDGKTVLSLIKHCYKAFCPSIPRLKKQTRRESEYQFKMDLIKRRRKNGDL
ncbi:MAG: hypothetical protein ABSA45_00725 [Verrucomicrobiota bacterium]|jgi:hypothetical protein